MDLPVYLDYCATTPCDPAVVAAMLPYFGERFGNAASASHAHGRFAADAVALAREQLATLIGADPTELIFTSGATEAINLALKGAMEMFAAKGRHLITCATEHKAVLDTCKHLERTGIEVTVLPVDSNGLIDLSLLEAAIRTDTVLVSIMMANNETGVIQPVQAISEIARRHGVLFFSDATQAVGKIPVDVGGIDLMACSAHKFYGPKGVGALYVRRKNPRVRLAPQIDGGGHERGLRSGTLNVPAIVGMGKAAAIAGTLMAEESKKLASLRNAFEQKLLRQPGVRVNGGGALRLPHVSNLSFESAEAQVLMRMFYRSLSVSSGSACTSATMEPSHVLKAMGLPETMAYNSIRFSLGRFTTETEMEFAGAEVIRCMDMLKTGGMEASTAEILK